MAYSRSLADRVRQALRSSRQIKERKMFGGIAFLLSGNMLVGVWQTSLIVRLGPERSADAFAKPYVLPFEISGRPTKGWVLVEADGLESDRQLAEWIERAMEFVSMLPAK
jgi:TfoX/Sxy family transcriptional regulator of competence genes